MGGRVSKKIAKKADLGGVVVTAREGKKEGAEERGSLKKKTQQSEEFPTLIQLRLKTPPKRKWETILKDERRQSGGGKG